MQTKDAEFVTPDISMQRAIVARGYAAHQPIVVLDAHDMPLGLLTSDDIRTGLLHGLFLSDSVGLFLEKKTLFTKPEDVRPKFVVDPEKNAVVLIAGGLGSRLGSLTETCPKPLLRVNDQPILEIILQNLKRVGFRRFYLSVNYMAEKIVEYFGSGSRWDIDITYLHEKTRLGTAGGLSLLPVRPAGPTLVMNGDLLTTLDLNSLMGAHVHSGAAATLGMKELEMAVPYGVVNFKNGKLVELREKPTYRQLMNAGIYVLNPEAIDLVPPQTYFDMPTLCDKVMKSKMDVGVFPIWEYWLDIGRTKDLERAKVEFNHIFAPPAAETFVSDREKEVDSWP